MSYDSKATLAMKPIELASYNLDKPLEAYDILYSGCHKRFGERYKYLDGLITDIDACKSVWERLIDARNLPALKGMEPSDRKAMIGRIKNEIQNMDTAKAESQNFVETITKVKTFIIGASIPVFTESQDKVAQNLNQKRISLEQMLVSVTSVHSRLTDRSPKAQAAGKAVITILEKFEADALHPPSMGLFANLLASLGYAPSNETIPSAAPAAVASEPAKKEETASSAAAETKQAQIADPLRSAAASQTTPRTAAEAVKTGKSKVTSTPILERKAI